MRLLLILLLFSTLIIPVNAQNTDQEKARTTFLEAEKSYQSGLYTECLTQLETAKQLLGRTNARIQYLTVKALVGQKSWTKAHTELESYQHLSDSSPDRIDEMKQTGELIAGNLAAKSSVAQPASGTSTTTQVKMLATVPAVTQSVPISAPNRPNNSWQPPHRIGLKVLTGIITVGVGAYALALNSQFSSKKSTLTDVARTTDSDNDGIITIRTDFNQWDTAYKEAQQAQSQNELFKVCVGVATLAALTEAYLLIHKPKPPRLSLRPASTNWGLAVHYNL